MALNDKNPVGDALQNALILNRIFVFLPTKFLLEHSSLVNKFWCEESRKFIRDNRKCTARILHESATKNHIPAGFVYESKVTPSAMNFVKFNEYLSETKTAVAYNGIAFALIMTDEDKQKPLWRCFNSSSNPGSCHSEAEYDKLCGIIRKSSSNLKLKYLAIDLKPVNCFYCSKHQYSVVRVLRAMSERIEHLKIVQVLSLMNDNVFLASDSTLFPKLETLEMKSKCVKQHEDLFKKIINSAPNLKQIANSYYEDPSFTIQILPQDKLFLLKRLRLEIFKQEDVEIYKKIGDFGPALISLFLVFPLAEDLAEFGAIFYQMVGQLLQGSVSSLKKLSFDGNSSDISAFFRSMPSSARMTNLFKLCFWSDGSEQDLCSCVRGIDFERFFPSLKQIQLYHHPGSRLDDDDEEELRLAPEVSYSSSTVVRLELQSNTYRNTNFNQLQEMFPGVTSLCLTSLSADNVVSLSPIFRLWPGLEGIQLQGQTDGLWCNYDSEFCGTSHEEMEYLWEQDDKFLKRVHIVPIRPCLSTLPKLNHVYVHAKSELGPKPETIRRKHMFVSEVTKFVVFKRLPFLRASLKLHYAGTATVIRNQGRRPMTYEYSPRILDLSCSGRNVLPLRF